MAISPLFRKSAALVGQAPFLFSYYTENKPKKQSVFQKIRAHKRSAYPVSRKRKSRRKAALSKRVLQFGKAEISR